MAYTDASLFINHESFSSSVTDKTIIKLWRKKGVHE